VASCLACRADQSIADYCTAHRDTMGCPTMAPTMTSRLKYNDTRTLVYTYWDMMDGDAMVCSLLGLPELRPLCSYNQYGLGVICLMFSLWFFYNARRLHGLGRRAIHPTKSVSRERQGIVGTGLLKSLLNTLACEFILMAVSKLVNGSGTIYSTSTAYGLIGDLMYSSSVACTMYHLLIQMRGARNFRNLVQLPTEMNKNTLVTVRLVLDTLQGALALPITFGLWLLLASGVITRPELTIGLYLLGTGVGTRSMFENVLDRVRTIIRVDELQQMAGGDFEAKRRRRKILSDKVRDVMLHMVVIFLVNVFVPLSVFIFGTYKSSTQILLHTAVCDTFVLLLALKACNETHKIVTSVCLKQANLAEESKGATRLVTGSSRLRNTKDEAFTVADQSGLSVVGESELAFGGRQKDNHEGGGLFTETESTV
jgi:hypothetical protein